MSKKAKGDREEKRSGEGSKRALFTLGVTVVSVVTLLSMLMSSEQVSSWTFVSRLLWLGVTCVWLVSIPLVNVSIVDVWWGAGVALSTAVLFLTDASNANDSRKTLIAGATVLWGARLSLYIFVRNFGSGEDYRYQHFRAKFGGTQRYWWFSYFQVFLLQGALQWVLVMPIVCALATPTTQELSLSTIDWVGGAVFATGFVFEAGADLQLYLYKRGGANKGKLLTSGFFSLTRNPNYFGDALQWWGLWLVASSRLELASLASVASPLLMTFLLEDVSGAALLEKGMRKRYKEFDAYASRVPRFWPWARAS